MSSSSGTKVKTKRKKVAAEDKIILKQKELAKGLRNRLLQDVDDTV